MLCNCMMMTLLMKVEQSRYNDNIGIEWLSKNSLCCYYINNKLGCQLYGENVGGFCVC